MFNTIDRLVQAGHFERVMVAGFYAEFRAVAIRYGCDNLRFSVNVAHPANQLFSLIDEWDNADALDGVAFYIRQEFADDFHFDKEVEDEEYEAFADEDFAA